MTTRSVRYQSLFPIEDLAKLHILIVGVGAYGRQCALRLAQMGINRLTIMDDDKVSIENLGPQGFRPDQIGDLKVDAVKDDISFINPDCSVAVYPSKFVKEKADTVQGTFDIIICAADSMLCRRELFDYFKTSRSRLYLDNRMGAETMVLYTIPDDPMIQSFFDTPDILFTDKEAVVAPCTARSTCYGADLCCAFTLAQITKWLRAMPLEWHTSVNLLSFDLFCDPQPRRVIPTLPDHDAITRV